jgi:hypothetical protein
MSKSFLTALATRAALLPWIGRVAAVAMLALLGWLGASIFWTLQAPQSASPSAVMETDVQRAQQTIVKRHLFGVYVAAAAAAAAPSNIRLTGVIAGQRAGQRAYALITVEGKAAQLVREGEEIAPGITLQRVLARQVEIQRGGQSQTLNLPESGKAATDAGKAGAVGTPPALVAEAPPAAPVVPPVPESPKPQAAPAPPAATIPLPQSGPIPPRRGRSRRSSEDDS